MPVLTVGAHEIAANRGEAESSMSRHEVVEWCLLNGLNTDRTWLRVYQGVECSTPVLTCSTSAPFSLCNDALPGAEEALNLLIGQLFVKVGLFQFFPLSMLCVVYVSLLQCNAPPHAPQDGS